MESENPKIKPMAVSQNRERLIVGGLCFFAALHVFIYSAAFPFFTNVDEPSHLGTILKFAHGEIPRTFDGFSAETIRCLALYNSSFYVGPATNTDSLLSLTQNLAATGSGSALAVPPPKYNGTNYQNSQPPVYYAVEGACWKIGEQLGIDEGHRLYCLRFVNIPIVALVVWLGWLAAKNLFPDQPFHRLAVPALIAVMPQSAFYSLESDTFSPLFFGAAFLLLLRLDQAEVPSPWLGAAAGLALAGTFLVKVNNAPPLLITAVWVMLWIWRRWRAGKLRPALPSLMSLGACAIVPVAAWSIWCRHTFGDFTGTRLKAEYWTWTPKPFAEWWSHPLFSLYGVRKFFALFLSQFWQGEFTRHCQPMALRVPSWIYALATVGLLALALLKLVRRPALLTALQRRTLWFGIFAFASCAAFLMYICVAFNFNHSPVPTPQFPFLTCGRFALSALIPFMLLLATGLDEALGRTATRNKFLVLAAILACMLGTEAATNWPAFGDQHNWFHL
jgi:hypothetical protein